MSTTVRGPAIASRVGTVLGIAIAVCFTTGLLSHWIQNPPGWFYWPAHPVWLYRVTQGAHVITGVASVPLLLVKLWSVFPKLFERPIIKSPVHAAERGSIAILVGAMIFELVTGIQNAAQWYPWGFFFPPIHYAVAWVAVGALLIHIAVKIPIIRDALGERQTDSRRRTVLRTAWIGAGVAAVAVAGQSIPALRKVSVIAPRSGEGPQDLPVNRTAIAAGVTDTAQASDYQLAVVSGDVARAFTRIELQTMAQTKASLPIACVEGWSASANWEGVPIRSLLDSVGAPRGRDVRVTSLERGGLYRSTTLPANFADDPITLVALRLNGKVLDLDHGYPCRLIAPARPGVLQTKWLSRIEVL
ncbi:molybdopterin-dependent oxidoreductase [Smaragdicoccus niigatensis]|uniref:molybdopterin-dependent oxidoreductase n=1 Tax=Smaragdicoccus niigatensis TaxID=359359 RepID=UPI0004768B93|nr:molybdopterin-dependent oxidoreductase [Smaragdicoccus niigatensis]